MSRKGQALSPKSKAVNAATFNTSSKTKNKSRCFNFDPPEPVLSRNLIDYVGTWLSVGNKYYEPPVDRKQLAKIIHANAHHESCLHFKRNMVLKYYVNNDVLPLTEFRPAVFERFVFGECYLQKIYNVFSEVVQLKHLPAISMRRMKARDHYCQLQPNGADPIEFKAGEVIHLKDYDVNQQIYGVPEYLGGMQSILLNESATLFRRKYYQNGAHMGYIMYVADGDFDDEDEDALAEQVENSKGAGNFSSLFLNLPGGRPDSVKIIPVGDLGTKDEFEKVKKASQNDIITIHRIQPALAGVISEANGGFGDIEKISRVQYENETRPAQLLFLEINQHLTAARQIRFDKPEFDSKA